jgi:hypothetical protein
MAAAFLVCALVLAGQQPATSTSVPTPSAAAAPVNVDDLPVSLDRIQRALAGPPPITLREEQPVFRLEIFGRKPTIEDILGERFWIGPVPYGGMTHQDFLNMVTPQLAQPYAGFTGKYLVAETALTLAETWALKTAIRKFRNAFNDREREAARKEVLEALVALDRARHAAEAKTDDKTADR